MKQVILIGLLLSFASSITKAQNLTDKLDQIFESAYDPAKSGAAILISKGGKTIYENQIGMANVEYQIPIKSKTKFHIGSITKQFTAAAILILEEEGKLDISNGISDYLSFISEDKKAVTIAQLLAHTSGIKDYPQIPEIRKQIRNNLSPRQIIDQVNEVELEFEPGSGMSYSNSGYMLLGMIIEAVSGQDYAAFLENRIFKVLQMNSTEVNNYEAIIANRAVGYSEDEKDQLIHATYHTSPYSAGAIVSTVGDLNKWVLGLHKGEIIGEKSLEKMFTNNLLGSGKTTDLGFGWEINQIAGVSCFEHSGFVPGYKANSVYIPEHDVYVVVMQNNEYGSPTPTMINAAALAIGKPYPSRLDSKQLSEEATINMIGTYQIAGGEERIISRDENGLLIKAHGGQASSLYVVDENTLFYQGGYRQIRFEKSRKGKIEGFTYSNRRLKRLATKISDTVPIEKNVVQVDLKAMKSLTGIYEFEPFNITVTMEEERLYVQPDGSNKLQLAPTSSCTFLVEEIGAEISFTTLSNEDIEASLLIEGDTMKGIRKKE